MHSFIRKGWQVARVSFTSLQESTYQALQDVKSRKSWYRQAKPCDLSRWSLVFSTLSNSVTTIDGYRYYPEGISVVERCTPRGALIFDFVVVPYLDLDTVSASIPISVRPDPSTHSERSLYRYTNRSAISVLQNLYSHNNACVDYGECPQ